MNFAPCGLFFEQFIECTISWIDRKANKVVDFLAKKVRMGICPPDVFCNLQRNVVHLVLNEAFPDWQK